MRRKKKIKIVAISDTHTKHNQVKVPKCDILLHAGDFSSIGRPNEVEDFLKWFNVQPAKHKVFISGNHDFMDHTHPDIFEKMLSLYPDIIYLRDEMTEVMGLKIWGRPWTPTFYDWAFMADRGSPKMISTFDVIPEGIDILLTHGPAYKILDRVRHEYVGCEDMLPALERIKPKMVVVGHIHESSGSILVDNILHVNAAILNDYYEKAYEPKVIIYDGSFTVSDSDDKL